MYNKQGSNFDLILLLKALNVAPGTTAAASITDRCPITWTQLPARKPEGPVDKEKEAVSMFSDFPFLTMQCFQQQHSEKQSSKNWIVTVPPLRTILNSSQRQLQSDWTRWVRRSPWSTAGPNASSRFDGWNHRVVACNVYICKRLWNSRKRRFTTHLKTNVWNKGTQKMLCARTHLSRLIEMTLSESSISLLSSPALLPSSSVCRVVVKE